MAIEVNCIDFGEIDAKNEVFSQERSDSHVFHNSFEIPPGVDIKKISVGSKIYIYGQKGCGKTALLLYVKNMLDQSGAKTRTVLFKSGITEKERQFIAQGKGFEFVEKDEIKSIEYDYKINWLWYIYRNAIRLIDPVDIDGNTDTLISLKKLIGVHKEVNTSLLSDLATKSIKILAKAGVKAGPFSGQIEAEVEAIKELPSDRLDIEIIEIIERHLPHLKIKDEKRHYLLFDELELFWNKPDQKDRDLFLIRDLLYSVSRVNRNIFSSNKFLTVIASVRTEVLNEVNRFGPEIARDVEDLGVRVNWNVKSDDINQPILKIIENKIKSSEIENDQSPTEDVWSEYFPNRVFTREFRAFLLENAMFKPRSLVTMLSLAKQRAGNAHSFSVDVIEDTQMEFSKRIWREIEEELSTEFSVDQVRAAKALLTGFKHIFSIVDLNQRLMELGKSDKNVRTSFFGTDDLVVLIRSLYRSGAIGNRYYVEGSNNYRQKRFGWIFRDSYEALLDKPFVVHESLRKELQLVFDNHDP